VIFYYRILENLRSLEKSHTEETEGSKKEISNLKELLAVQQAATDAEKRHVTALEFKLKQAELARMQLEQAPLTVRSIFSNAILFHKLGFNWKFPTVQ